MNRTHLALAGLLLLQLVMIALLGGDDARDGGEPRALLAALDGLEPSRVELVDEDGDRLEIVRGDDGWTLPAADGFPADAEKLEMLLEDLRGLEVRRPVVRSARHHDTFRVTEDDFVGRLRIWGDEDDPAVDLLLGSASNYRTTHARLAGEDPVYEVEGLAPYDLRPAREAWIDKALVALDAGEVATFRLTTDEASIALREAPSGWTFEDGPAPDGLELDPAAVDRLIRAATDLRAIDSAGVVDPAAHGLATPAAVVELETADGRTARLTIGAPLTDDEAKRHAAADGSGFAVSVWQSSVDRLLDASRDALLRPATGDGDGDGDVDG